MLRLLAVALLLFAVPALAQTSTNWMLESSTLTYQVTHPLHQVHGVSHAAKGKGVCQAGECDFLIAAPVKSFDSGDSNRDLHMLQVTRGADYPMIVVRTEILEAATTSPTISANLTVQFAGQTAHYNHVPFQRVIHGNQVEISGTIPATCSDFHITRPSFFSVPIQNSIPVQVDMTWKQM